MKYLSYISTFLFTLHVQAQEATPANISHIITNDIVGDVNGDGRIDMAKAEFDRLFTSTGFENDCGKPVCEVKVTFGEGIDPIVFEAMNVKVGKVIDVNGDGKNEVAFYRWRYECCWVTLDLYSYKTGKWEIIGTTKAFMSGNNEDYDRLKLDDEGYFLIGQKWNDDSSEIMENKVLIRQ